MSRSDTLATRRTFHLIRTLQRGQADKATLRNVIIELEGEDAYGKPSALTTKKQDERFRKDKDRAENQFGIQIEFERSQGAYEITGIADHGWFDLSDEALIGLVLLQEIFGQEDAPEGQKIRTLLDALLPFLPAERRLLVERKDAARSLDLRVLDQSEIQPIVFEVVEGAVQRKHLLRFNYLSPRNQDQAPRRHYVEPYKLHFRDGHWYFYAYWLESMSHFGPSYPERYQNFRLSYIQPTGLKDTGIHFPQRSPERTRTLRYLLHPDLARGAISHHFPNTQKRGTQQIRGKEWREVTAEIRPSDEFRATQTLFRYAEKCKVLEPKSMVKRIRAWFEGMDELYGEQGNEFS